MTTFVLLILHGGIGTTHGHSLNIPEFPPVHCVVMLEVAFLYTHPFERARMEEHFSAKLAAAEEAHKDALQKAEAAMSLLNNESSETDDPEN